MGKRTKYLLQVEIDKLTNSIVNKISGDSFLTEVHEITKDDLKIVSKRMAGYLGGPQNINLKTGNYISLQ